MDLPAFRGVAFRRVRGPEDFAPTAEVITRSREATGFRLAQSADSLAAEFDHATDFDPATDVLVAEATIEGRVGGRVDPVRGPYRAHMTGHVREWQPPRLLEYDAHVEAAAGLPGTVDGVIRWELFPRAGGTLLVLTFRGLSKPVAAVFAGGLKRFFARLEALLDGRPLPDPQPGDA